MPHVIDPPGGALGNWNNKPMPGWANGNAVTWGSVDHVQRILTLLAGSTPLSPDMIKDIAHDIGRHDYRADALLPFLLDALAVPGVWSDSRLPQARQILADWDRQADEGAVGESIFGAWRTQVLTTRWATSWAPSLSRFRTWRTRSATRCCSGRSRGRRLAAGGARLLQRCPAGGSPGG